MADRTTRHSKRSRRRESPALDPQRVEQRQLQRQHNRLRTQALAGWRELEKRVDRLTQGEARRVPYFVKAAVETWKRRGSQHAESFLGPAALTRRAPGWGSRSSHKRAKRQVLDVYETRELVDGKPVIVEGLGLLRRTHRGGGRLARPEGGRAGDGRFRGNADGFMPGPEILGWGPEEYRQLKLGAPAAPAGLIAREEGETAAAHRERERRLQGYLERQGYAMPDGP